jgi:hypothetical protein
MTNFSTSFAVFVLWAAFAVSSYLGGFPEASIVLDLATGASGVAGCETAEDCTVDCSSTNVLSSMGGLGLRGL